MKWRLNLLPLLAGGLIGGAVNAASLDDRLVKLSSLIVDGEWDKAATLARDTVESYPGSRAAQLMAADLSNVAAGRLVSMDPSVSFSPNLLEILNELKKRRHHAARPPSPGTLPDVLLQPSSLSQHVIAVDLQASRLYLLARDANGDFALSEDHYVSIGLGGSGKQREGDLRTPVGIYDINGFKPDDRLPGLYGTGAFTLAFPNRLDRQQGITGSGIWLHGMPHDQLSRPPQDSEGCVVMRNDLIEHLRTSIDPTTTPVILAPQLTWVSPTALQLPPDAPWTDASTSQYDALAFNHDENDGLTTLFDGKPGLAVTEVYRYPLTVKNMHTSLFRVRILHNSSRSSDEGESVEDQYWSYDTTVKTWRRVDSE